MQAAGIEALGHKWLVRSRLNLEIDTGPSLLRGIPDLINRSQKRLRMCAAVRDVTRPLCLTAALGPKCDCLSEAVYDQMWAIAFHSAMFQVLATNACAPWKQ